MTDQSAQYLRIQEQQNFSWTGKLELKTTISGPYLQWQEKGKINKFQNELTALLLN